MRDLERGGKLPGTAKFHRTNVFRAFLNQKSNPAVAVLSKRSFKKSLPECKNLDSNFKNPNIPLLSNINNILCFIFCDTSFWLLAFCMPTIVKLHSLINGGYKLFNIFSTLSCSTLLNFVDTFRQIWYSFYFIFLLYVIYYSIWSFVFCLQRKPHPSNYFNSSIK